MGLTGDPKLKTLGIIPARGGSKGIPFKNIKLLSGKPLIAYTIESAHQASVLDVVIVSTDSLDIAEISRKYSAEVIMRPPELATDEAVIRQASICEGCQPVL